MDFVIFINTVTVVDILDDSDSCWYCCCRSSSSCIVDAIVEYIFGNT